MGSGEESVPPPPPDAVASGSGQDPEGPPEAPAAPEAEASAEGQAGAESAGPSEASATTQEGADDVADDAAATSRPEDREDREDREDPEDPDEPSELVEERPLPTSHTAPALISLEQVGDDETFRIRPEGELSLLATDIARLGQLFPVDLRQLSAERFQLITGFRRVAALRFLQREKVLARVHTDLSDEDALLMALAAAIHHVPVSKEELSELKGRLEEEGRLTAATRDMLEKAVSDGDSLAPENVEEEIDADELANDVSSRLGEINQDLSLLADVFASLDEARRAELLTQLRYSAELVAFLEGLE